MKLCKDCKHADMPTGLNAMAGVQPYCLHPDMPRDPVYGAVTISCGTARSRNVLPPWNICGEEGKLFEDRPPADPVPAFEPTPYVLQESTEKKSWLKRIFGA